MKLQGSFLLSEAIVFIAQKARENGNIGIDDITEYFLVGSFASWILALAGVALAQ
jgi:hypothetical protein